MEYEYVTNPDNPHQIGLKSDALTVWFGWAKIESELKKAEAEVRRWERVKEELGKAQAKKEPKHLTLPPPLTCQPNKPLQSNCKSGNRLS